jgi:hypothetical protein
MVKGYYNHVCPHSHLAPVTGSNCGVNKCNFHLAPVTGSNCGVKECIFHLARLNYIYSVMGKILFKSILKIENKIVQKKYFENNKIKYFTKVFSKYKIK